MGRGKGAVKKHNQKQKKTYKDKQRKKKHASQEKASDASAHSHVSSVTPPSPVLHSSVASGGQTSSEIQTILNDAANLTERVQKEASEMKRSVTDKL